MVTNRTSKRRLNDNVARVLLPLVRRRTFTYYVDASSWRVAQALQELTVSKWKLSRLLTYRPVRRVNVQGNTFDIVISQINENGMRRDEKKHEAWLGPAIQPLVIVRGRLLEPAQGKTVVQGYIRVTQSQIIHRLVSWGLFWLAALVYTGFAYWDGQDMTMALFFLVSLGVTTPLSELLQWQSNIAIRSRIMNDLRRLLIDIQDEEAEAWRFGNSLHDSIKVETD